MSDLTEVIEESLEDATPAPDDTLDETTPETDEVAPESTNEPAPEETPTDEVPSPAAAAGAAETDEFSKKFGIPAQSVTGRENRLPYSRVKKITEKAVADTRKEVEAEYTPKVQEYETKIKDYESRLTRVAEFEQVMVNDPEKFFQVLATIPAYSEFFAFLKTAVEQAERGGGRGQQTAAGAQAEQTPDGMPQPNEQLPDGTWVYNMDGLRARDAWNREQAKKEALAEVEKRFGPIEKAYNAEQVYQANIPKVRAQIAEARTWPGFTENEDAITQALAANPKLSLEGAWRTVVLPKLQADRNKIREEVLAEVKRAPRATSATTAASKAGVSQSTGPRSLEDVIRDSIKDIQ